MARRKAIEEYFPPVDELAELPMEELGLCILNYLCDMEELNERGQLNRYNFMLAIGRSALKDFEKNIAEGLHWLDREVLIAARPGQDGSWIFVTRNGWRLYQSSDLRSYLFSAIIPRGSLNPVLENKARHLFLRGDYDTAIFQAFKEVEITVRKASGYGNDMYGVPLMRKAFSVDDGPLTDLEQEEPERQAVSHLFAGALGLFKNPTSHRDVNIDDPYEAAELMLFANYLIRFVERRADSGDEE